MNWDAELWMRWPLQKMNDVILAIIVLTLVAMIVWKIATGDTSGVVLRWP
jgi:hypothetical protein